MGIIDPGHRQSGSPTIGVTNYRAFNMRYQSLISQLQQALRMPGSVDQAALRRAAEEYAILCDQLVQVINEATFFLERGCRSEALRLCERQPSVFAQFDALSFPERANWLPVARNMGVDTPDFPNRKLKQLNDAYDNHDEALTSKLRILNVLNRPPKERVAVLTALIKKDPYNPVWKENLDEIRRTGYR